ncbi:hypothetical protein D3C80_1440520 [compost metagenome]
MKRKPALNTSDEAQLKIEKSRPVKPPRSHHGGYREFERVGESDTHCLCVAGFAGEIVGNGSTHAAAFAKRPATRFHGPQYVPRGEEHRVGHPAVLIDRRAIATCRHINRGCVQKRCLRREPPGEENTIALDGEDTAICQPDVGLLDTTAPTNVHKCCAAIGGHSDQSGKPPEKRPRQRFRLRLDHRHRPRAMRQACEKRGKGNQFRTKDKRPAKGHDAVKGDIGLQCAGGDHSHRPVARQEPR